MQGSVTEFLKQMCIRDRYWVALIQPGKVLYEMDGVPEELALSLIHI